MLLPPRRRLEPPQPPATALEAGVDRTLAGVGYALIGASLFTVWITGLIAWVIAWTHRKSPDPLARAHFRYQLWVADLAGLAVGVGFGVLRLVRGRLVGLRRREPAAGVAASPAVRSR